LASALHAQADFFQGKSLRLIRGAQAGDLYDLWTRHIATYFGKHVPGHPSVTVQNMPGAGSEKNALKKTPIPWSMQRKRGWPVDPIGGEELATLAKEVTLQPPEVVQRLKKTLTRIGT
jgi:hypothetical protein